jgi:hypothetical protein
VHRAPRARARSDLPWPDRRSPSRGTARGSSANRPRPPRARIAPPSRARPSAWRPATASSRPRHRHETQPIIPRERSPPYAGSCREPLALLPSGHDFRKVASEDLVVESPHPPRRCPSRRTVDVERTGQGPPATHAADQETAIIANHIRESHAHDSTAFQPRRRCTAWFEWCVRRSPRRRGWSRQSNGRFRGALTSVAALGAVPFLARSPSFARGSADPPRHAFGVLVGLRSSRLAARGESTCSVIGRRGPGSRPSTADPPRHAFGVLVGLRSSRLASRSESRCFVVGRRDAARGRAPMTRRDTPRCASSGFVRSDWPHAANQGASSSGGGTRLEASL